MRESTADTQEQTSTDSTTKSDELDVPRFETERPSLATKLVESLKGSYISIPTSHISVFFSGRQITVHVRRLTHPDPFLVDHPRHVVVGRRIIAVFPCRTDVVLFLVHLLSSPKGTRFTNMSNDVWVRNDGGGEAEMFNTPLINRTGSQADKEFSE